MQSLDTDQYLCPAQSSRHDQWFLCEQFIEMCDGWITARDAVIILLSASWSPVKDKETPVAQLTLSDGLCEKQPWAHAQGLRCPLLPPSGTRERERERSVAESQMTSLVKQLKECTKKCSPQWFYRWDFTAHLLFLKHMIASTQQVSPIGLLFKDWCREYVCWLHWEKHIHFHSINAWMIHRLRIFMQLLSLVWLKHLHLNPHIHPGLLQPLHPSTENNRAESCLMPAA